MLIMVKLKLLGLVGNLHKQQSNVMDSLPLAASAVIVTS